MEADGVEQDDGMQERQGRAMESDGMSRMVGRKRNGHRERETKQERGGEVEENLNRQ
ncbi:hypothetical protein M407DRAFT_244127 [Tulasnella calospora MUT 4182]|uniref:Uncharacterized protein n=1 Tax=Tulasnella calospora MUT 4182 TaxID=1051891 RepID=A0A0C3QG71_9AGAM|nr:hypothetical protein M407DRAFT_244127 [Tulasnella calospora MUT 4182]